MGMTGLPSRRILSHFTWYKNPRSGHNYACHLTTINLAIRDLIDDDNYPRVHLGDFLRYTPDSIFSLQPIGIRAGGLRTETREIRVERGRFDAIVGNPPYISARAMNATDKGFYYDAARRLWPSYPWSRAADIYTYFWLHAEQFLNDRGRLALLTQAAWLDVEYGVPVQKWMLDHFRILGIFETEAEPWFSDARVATVVSLLVRENDAELRRANLVRFVQFRSRLSTIVDNATSEQQRQMSFEKLRDRILATACDLDEPDLQIRLISQDDLERAGTSEDGNYCGSKWGRYFRSTKTLYQIQREHPDRFALLEQLAPVERGVTTNCDDFFIVKDISGEALASTTSASAFRESYGVSRHQVELRQVQIIQRKDGVAFALESDHLRAILKTARDFDVFTTGGVETCDFAVFISENRNELSTLTRRYVLAGEREGWHEAPSFINVRNNGGNWYTLRDADAAPILLVKTMQYSPFVLLNESSLIPNQRLYKVTPMDGVDAKALCAVMNSTVFACERYAAVKALGREAAFDVEVFSANAYRTPDIRHFNPTDLESLSALMDKLCARHVGTLLEEPIAQLGLSAARTYVQANPVCRELWPSELRDSTRQEIDRIVLRNLGVPARQIPAVREQIYNEIIEYIRKLRLLELEAQRNRAGNESASTPTPAILADEILTQLLEAGTIRILRVPDELLPSGADTKTIHIPAKGAIAIQQRSLFGSREKIHGQLGNVGMEFDSVEEASYLSLLSENGIVGDVKVPVHANVCEQVRLRIDEYLGGLKTCIQGLVVEATTDEQLQKRIFSEAWRHVTTRAA